MSIISFIQRKGGVGKSTLACLLSAHLSLNNKKVLLLDIDPQNTSYNWASKTQYDLSYEKILNNEHFDDVIKKATSKKLFDYIIIDTAGFEGDINIFVMGKSDFVILPVSNSEEDLKGAIHTYNKVKQVQEIRHDTKPVSYLIFNDVNKRTALFESLYEAAKDKIEILAVISRRVAFQEIFSTYKIPDQEEELKVYVESLKKKGII